MGFFGKLIALIRGFFIRAGDDMVAGSPEAIRSTYAAAIVDAQKRYKDLEGAVALLARERERTADLLKTLNEEDKELRRKLEGALAAAEADPTNPAPREAGARYQMQLEEIEAKQAKIAQELDVQQKKVEEYKGKLRQFTGEIERLKREQGEVIAEWISSRQVLMLEDRLKGLGETAVDQSIVAIREKIANMKARAKIAGEMSTAEVTAQDTDYARMGAEQQAAAKFDEMLKARMEGKGETTKVKTRDLG
jgi:phage shock protein A